MTIRKFWIWFLIGCVLVPVFALAQDESKTSLKSNKTSDEFPIDGFSPGELKGHWGIGATSIDKVSPAVSARYWLNNKEALDFSLGGYETNAADWDFGISLSHKRNFARPVEDVYAQWMFKASFTRFPNASASALETDDLSFFFGPGFEAFMPFWKNLSLEAFIGGIINLQIYPNTPNNLSIAIGGDNFSLFNLAVHFYFEDK